MQKSPSIQNSNPVATVYDHEKYARLSIQQIRWIMKSIGIWPNSFQFSSPIMKYVRVLINVICVGIVTFVFIPCVFYVVLEVEDIYNTLKFIGPLSFCLMTIVKYSTLAFRRRDIRVCIEHIKTDWTKTWYHDDRAIMTRNAVFGRRLIVINGFFAYSGAIFFHIAMPIGMGKITESNLTYQPLAYPVARVIVDTRYSPINEIFFWTQFVSAVISQTVATATCGLTAVLAVHAYGRLEVLMQWIMHLVDGREDFSNNVDDRLAIIVQEHVRILCFIELTEKVLHKISLVEVMGNTLNICLLGYYTIMEWEDGFAITYIILLMSVVFNLFIFCYIGELVAEQFKRVSEISYMIDWHRLSGRKALAIVLMIAISNSSVKLTAGNIIELSMTSFGDVIKTSVAYLNMLRALTT
ncbi:PREDICTED: odorant receptor 49a-like [Trachymyrmex septentrionalis]|uniref:odorant receptor 49a-like n=1 Tax=Trachymyrmex septentrionalis TaxID=34720 RepID=UPI00084F1E6C|nr:PREDICTED: odorant receptor 49a-like [Trachymyrmex septentrionalis]